MPAVNPAALDEKLDTIFSNPIRSGTFSREIESLLNFYADRTRRSSTVAAALETAGTLHVPAPVLRTLCAKIHRRGCRVDDEWLEAAGELWNSGLREMQLVSICMLREAPQEKVLATASHWAAESDDPKVLESLASEGIQSVRLSDPASILALAGEWIADERTRAFGLIALQKQVEEGVVADLSEIFLLISQLAAVVRGRDLDALRRLLSTLGQSSPAETTAFLIEEIQADETRTSRLIRALSDDFAEPFKSQLLSVL